MSKGSCKIVRKGGGGPFESSNFFIKGSMRNTWTVSFGAVAGLWGEEEPCLTWQHFPKRG